MQIYFLHHSGFALDDGQSAYIFDYYKDPAGHVAKLYEQGRKLYFFVSHKHGDHYEPSIKKFNGSNTQYIAYQDVPLQGVETISFMEPGQVLSLENLEVTMFGSTDEGGSYLLDTGEKRIFHAGDLNWWHWSGDTAENIVFARRFMEEQMAALNGLSVDIAMFPVDARLEEAREWGIWEFLHRMTVKKLVIPMHAFGPVWTPSVYYQARFGQIPLWIPQHDGERFCLND